MPVSSRGQDTWFSATGPGFESPYRYQLSNLQAVSAEPWVFRPPSRESAPDEGNQCGSTFTVATSVWMKSVPLNNNGSPFTIASAYEKQSP